MTLSVTAHAATTRHLASCYFLQADAPLGDGPLLGLDARTGAPFCFEPFAAYRAGLITNPNLLVLGEVGSGKSTVAKLLCWVEAALLGRSVAILDPKGEYGPLAQLLGLPTLRLEPGGSTRLNPLELNPLELAAPGALVEHTRQRSEVLSALGESGLGRPLSPEEHAALSGALGGLSGLPELAQVVEALLDPSAALAAALRTTSGELRVGCREPRASRYGVFATGDLAGMFNGRSTVPSRHEAARGVHVDLSPVYAHPSVLAPTMIAAGSWLTSALAAHGRQHLLVLDETWQVLADPGIGRWLRGTMKLARALGAAVVLVTHGLSDFRAVGDERSEAARLAASLVGDTASRALLSHADAAAAETASALELSRAEASLLPRLRRGIALWHVGEHAALVRHLVPPALEQLLDTDAEMARRSRGGDEMNPAVVGLAARPARKTLFKFACWACGLVLFAAVVVVGGLGGIGTALSGAGGSAASITAGATAAALPSGGHDLSIAAIGAVAERAGFSGSSLAMAIAVALAESGGDPQATDFDSNGTVDRGLWQINSVHTQYSADCDDDPPCAASAAFAISAGGTDWDAWVTYQRGAEIPYLPEAIAVSVELQDRGSDGPPRHPHPERPCPEPPPPLCPTVLAPVPPPHQRDLAGCLNLSPGSVAQIPDLPALPRPGPLRPSAPRVARSSCPLEFNEGPDAFSIHRRPATSNAAGSPSSARRRPGACGASAPSSTHIPTEPSSSSPPWHALSGSATTSGRHARPSARTLERLASFTSDSPASASGTPSRCAPPSRRSGRAPSPGSPRTARRHTTSSSRQRGESSRAPVSGAPTCCSSQAALDYAAHELPVLALRPGDKAPHGLLVPHGLKDATTSDPGTDRRRWWRRVPSSNVGIRTGAAARGRGIDVIDLDSEAASRAFARGRGTGAASRRDCS